MVPMYPLVLFGGTGVEVLMHRGQFVISLEEGWIKFITDTHQIAELLKVLGTDIIPTPAMFSGDACGVGQRAGGEDFQPRARLVVGAQ